MQALVTGAAKRLGRTIALTLHGAGDRVAVHYRTSRAEAEETSALLGGAPLIKEAQAKEPERTVADAAPGPDGLCRTVGRAARLLRAAPSEVPPAPCWARPARY